MILNKENVYGLMSALYTIFVSYVLATYYVNGDQSHYQTVYYLIKDFSLFSSIGFYQNALNSNEIIHFLFINTFSRLGFNKDVVMSLVNGLFSFAFVKLLVRSKCHGLLIILIVPLNFYLWVLYLSAERLKFGFLFMIISFLYLDSKKKYLYLFLSLISHAQMILVFVMGVMNKISSELITVFRKGKLTKNIFYLLVTFIVFSLPVLEQLTRKIAGYAANYDFSVNDLIKVAIFVFLIVLFSENKYKAIFTCMPLFICTLIFGSSRILLFLYFYLLFVSVRVKGGLNFPFLLVTGYFSYQCIIFFTSIFKFGDGFRLF